MSDVGADGRRSTEATAASVALPVPGELVDVVSVTAYWKGSDGPFDVDALVTAEAGNRWNHPGEPTVYLAGDPGVALIEAGRHQTGTGPGPEVEGVVWSLHVEAPNVLDLRREDVRQALALREPYWFLGRAACQDLARALRRHYAGILTQSAGLPDVADRWNLVLFVDRLARQLVDVVSRPRKLGSFRLALDDGNVQVRTTE